MSFSKIPKATRKERDSAYLHESTEQTQKQESQLTTKTRKSFDKISDSNVLSQITTKLRRFSLSKEVLIPSKLMELARGATTLNELESKLVSLFSVKPELAIDRLSSLIIEYSASLSKLSKQTDQSAFKGAFRTSIDATTLIKSLIATVLDGDSIKKLSSKETRIHHLATSIIKTLSFYIVQAKIDLAQEEGINLKKELTKLVACTLKINSSLSEAVSSSGMVTAAPGIAYILTNTQPFEINTSLNDLENLQAQAQHSKNLTSAFLKLFPEQETKIEKKL